jgi:hypothetical protein
MMITGIEIGRVTSEDEDVTRYYVDRIMIEERLTDDSDEAFFMAACDYLEEIVDGVISTDYARIEEVYTSSSN